MKIQTNLYDLIRSMQEGTSSNDSGISKRICLIAEAGRLRWLADPFHGIPLNIKERRPKAESHSKGNGST